MSDIVPIFEDEGQLMSWGESDTQGAWIKVRLLNSEALAPFRGMTKAKGDKAGQRLAIVMVEIGDDELPKAPEKPKGGPLSILAGRWCQDEAFQQWTKAQFQNVVANLSLCSLPTDARQIILYLCEIDSRRELDHNAQAAGLFDRLIRRPYAAHLGAM